MASDGETIVAGAALPPAARGPKRPIRIWLWPVVAVVVGIAVVGALFATGVYPSHAGSSTASTPSFSAASATGRTAAESVSGGPWSLVAATAVNSAAGLSFDLSSFSTANCSLTPASLGALATSLHVPTDASFSSGTSPWWALLYVGRASTELLIVLVVNGTADPLAVGQGTCVETLLGLSTIPGAVIDSPPIASSGWSNGGSVFASTFHADHPTESLNLLLGLYGGGSIPGLNLSTPSLGASYLYELSPCGLGSSANPSGTQPYFFAVLNATYGTVTLTHASSLTCTNLTGLHLGLGGTEPGTGGRSAPLGLPSIAPVARTVD